MLVDALDMHITHLSAVCEIHFDRLEVHTLLRQRDPYPAYENRMLRCMIDGKSVEASQHACIACI